MNSATTSNTNEPGSIAKKARHGGTAAIPLGTLALVLTAAGAVLASWHLGPNRVQEEELPPLAFRQVCQQSPALGAAAPDGAIVLFDGSSTEHFSDARMTRDGLLMAGATTRRPFCDFHLHLEFRVPHQPDARGQARGNSGVYLQQRYEVQILDSLGKNACWDDCGALYKQRKPGVNACLPPLAWQTYDIDFTAARYDAAGVKTKNARITVIHNGVVIHDDVELTTKTGAGQPEGSHALPILLQDHGSPVVYRNIWLVENYPPGATQLAANSR